MKYYVIDTQYVGPNVDEHLNDHYIIVTTEPPRTNLSGEIRTEGWLGTTNDYAKYACGEFDDLEEAIEAAQEECGEEGYLEEALNYEDECDGIVYKIRVGIYDKMSAKAASEYFYDSIREFVKPDMTDDYLSDEAQWWITSTANDTGMLFDEYILFRDMLEYRDLLKQELDEAES